MAASNSCFLISDEFDIIFLTYLLYIVHGKCILDNLKLLLNTQDGRHFSRWPLYKWPRWPLVRMSDTGDLGVKSVIVYDAEFKFRTLKLARSFLLPHN